MGAERAGSSSGSEMPNGFAMDKKQQPAQLTDAPTPAE
jgi:hypothetical protein